MWPKLQLKPTAKVFPGVLPAVIFLISSPLWKRRDRSQKTVKCGRHYSFQESTGSEKDSKSFFSAHVAVWLPLALAIHPLCQLSNLNTITTITMIHHNAESMQDDTHGAQKYLSKRQAFNDKVSASIFCVPWASCSDRAGRPACISKVISISSSGSAILRVGELVATGDPGAPYKRNSVRSSAGRIQRGLPAPGWSLVKKIKRQSKAWDTRIKTMWYAY